MVTNLLSRKSVVFVGLISYSLYLWHWPIVVFAKHVAIVPLTPLQSAGVLLVSGIAATITWRWVERPFRHGQLVLARVRVFQLAGALSALVIGVGLGLRLTDGLPDRFNDAPGPVLDDADWTRWADCQTRVTRLDETGTPCLVGNRDGEPTFLFWGDSHARAMATGLDLSASRAGATGVIATMNGCAPLLGIERVNRTRCVDFNRGVLHYVTTHPKVSTIVLAARWAVSAEGTLLQGRDES